MTGVNGILGALASRSPAGGNGFLNVAAQPWYPNAAEEKRQLMKHKALIWTYSKCLLALNAWKVHMLKKCKTSKNCWTPGVFPLETMLFAKLLKPPSGVPHHGTTHRPARTIQSGPCQLMCTPIGPQVHEGINKTKSTWVGKRVLAKIVVVAKCFRCVFCESGLLKHKNLGKSESKNTTHFLGDVFLSHFLVNRSCPCWMKGEVCSSRSQHACLQSSGHQVPCCY